MHDFHPNMTARHPRAVSTPPSKALVPDQHTSPHEQHVYLTGTMHKSPYNTGPPCSASRGDGEGGVTDGRKASGDDSTVGVRRESG